MPHPAKHTAHQQRRLVTVDRSTAIDMVGPAQACAMLQTTPTELIALVNNAALAAYDLDGSIRFTYRGVVSLASRRAIAT